MLSNLYKEKTELRRGSGVRFAIQFRALAMMGSENRKSHA